MVTMTGFSSERPCRGRMRMRSHAAPIAKPMTSTRTKAHQYPTPRDSRLKAMNVVNMPAAPCAKLMIRVAR